jgi:hypothetical protein
MSISFAAFVAFCLCLIVKTVGRAKRAECSSGDALRKWMLVQMESAMHWGLGGSTMGRPCMLNMIGVDIYMVHLT